METDTALSRIETKYGFKFKEKQSLAVKSIVERNDTFVVLPTGFGKTKIYMHLPEVFQLVKGKKGNVLVISPLQSLMLDQIRKLKSLGIEATVVGECQTDKSIATKIAEGEFSIVFSSPEAALVPGLWRRSLTNGKFVDNLMTVVVDEAHCITQWGCEFRHEYGKLAELRSVIPCDTSFVALTATATKSMRTDIMKKLQMTESETVTVCQLNERTNITYLVKKSKKNVNQLSWLLQDLQENGVHAKKTIVYCRNIKTCGYLFEHFCLNLLQSNILEERLVAMFHRCTAPVNKEHVLHEFPKSDSLLRVVFATVAFGMGIDIPDVEFVVHFGAPRGLEEFAQESGRAGRDGRQSISCVYYSSVDIAKNRSSLEVREFCKSPKCLREVMNKYFALDDTQSSTMPTSKCECCSICASDCECGSCISHVCLNDTKCTLDISVSRFVDDDDDDDEIPFRNLSNHQLSILHDNLIDFQDVLTDEGLNDDNYFNMDIINVIVENSSYLLCAEDVMSLGLVDYTLSTNILELIEEVEFL